VGVVVVVVVVVLAVVVVVLAVVVVVVVLNAVVGTNTAEADARVARPGVDTAACAPIVPPVAKIVTETNPSIHIQRRGPRRHVGARTAGSEPDWKVDGCSNWGTCDFRPESNGP
jgi:hypothetical protein